MLDDDEGLRSLMTRAAVEAGAHVVGEIFHRFSPHGVTGVVVVEESHLSIHTWPEHGYAAVDFYTCGTVEPRVAVELLEKGLGADRADVLHVERGRASRPSLRMADLRTAGPRAAERSSARGAREGSP
jgi:S-adenosylmethionine decarboxylase proenzyme